MSALLEHMALAEMTAQIVSAYVAHQKIAAADVPSLIGSVANNLAGLELEGEAAAQKPRPAVAVRRSIGKDHITCLVCGQKRRILKPHLTRTHHLTPADYRELFELRSDYPMTAPSYAATRAEIARRSGLGGPKRTPPRPSKTTANGAREVTTRAVRPQRSRA